MIVSVSIVLLLGVLVWFLVHYTALRAWQALICVLFGFYVAASPVAPDIRKFNQQFGLVTTFCRAATPIGLWRLLGETGIFPYPVLAYAAPDQRARAQTQTYRTAYCSMIEQETRLSNLEASAAIVRASRRPLGDLPLIILTAGSGYPSEGWRQGWLAQQADLRSLSTRSEQRIIAEASHYNLTTDRADVAVDAVRDVLGMITRPR